jgi:hypothetical protein
MEFLAKATSGDKPKKKTLQAAAEEAGALALQRQRMEAEELQNAELLLAVASGRATATIK